MSEKKFTPGPWEVDSAKDGDGRYFIVNGQIPRGIKADFGYPVCDTMNRHHCIDPEEDEANARLIAAAPELLEALENLLQVCRGNTSDEIAEAQTAIRKATGE